LLRFTTSVHLQSSVIFAKQKKYAGPSQANDFLISKWWYAIQHAIPAAKREETSTNNLELVLPLVFSIPISGCCMMTIDYVRTLQAGK
jgi:hypothetical protein